MISMGGRPAILVRTNGKCSDHRDFLVIYASREQRRIQLNCYNRARSTNFHGKETGHLGHDEVVLHRDIGMIESWRGGWNLIRPSKEANLRNRISLETDFQGKKAILVINCGTSHRSFIVIDFRVMNWGGWHSICYNRTHRNDFHGFKTGHQEWILAYHRDFFTIDFRAITEVDDITLFIKN